NNVIDAHSDIAEQMRSDLLALMARMKTRRRAAEPVELDDAAIERLAGLGYVAGPSPPEDLGNAAGLRDPKEMLEIYGRFTQALEMILARDYEQAVSALEPLIRQSPESDMLHAVLGAAYLNLKRFKEAERAFEASLRTVRETPKRLCGLAYALWKQDKLEGALACYGEVLEIAPDWEEAHRGLAGVYLQTKQLSLAEPHCRRCVELDPTSVPYLTNLGVVLVRLSRPAEGVPLLQRALEYYPANESAHRALWQGLVALGRREEAIRSLQAGRDVLPGARSITCPLAWLLATTPRRTFSEVQDAVQWAEECCEAGSGHPRDFDTLAAAYAASGDFLKAAEAARRAISMADARGRRDLQRQIEARLRLYEAGQPFVERGRP
ncbi:MAG: tetratricopeptide repeat protein, partial [Planctomycetota bacterium]